MTRKDYVRLAQALRDAPIASNAGAQWEVITQAIADALAADNPCFDRARFLAACKWDRE